MKTGLKVLVLAILVIAVSLSIFVSGFVPQKGLKDVTMIAARWNFAGYDRYGRKLLEKVDAQTSTTLQHFTLSTDPGNGSILVTNPNTSKVMTFNSDGKFLYDKSYAFKPYLNENSTCSPIELKGLAACTKKLKYRNISYLTDIATANVYVNNEYRLANPEKVKLTEPVQTAVFEDLQNWREYVIDRAGNKLVCFQPLITGNAYDVYSSFQWVLPQGCALKDAPAGNDVGSFILPSGVCVDGSGNVYVSDYGNGRVQKFEADGKCMCIFTEGLKKPTAIAANENKPSDKMIYVTDAENKKVVVFNSDSAKVELTISNDQFVVPSAITVGLDGSIWVGDCGADKIFKFSGMNSDKPGQLLLTVNDVLASKKLQKNILEVELKKYSCKKNGETVKIKPYAQTVDKITYVPLKFIFDNLLNDPARAEVAAASYEYDKTTKSCLIKIGQFTLDDDSVYSERTVKVTLDSDVATLNGQEIKLPGKVTNIAGSVFIPASSLKDLFDVSISYKDRRTEPVTMNNVYTYIFPPLK